MSNDYIAFIIGALLLQCLILYVVISAAVNAHKNTTYNWAQTIFLAYLAKKEGMPQEEIDKIMEKI